MKTFQPIKVDNCSSCGSTINQYSPNSETIICQHCGNNSTNKNPSKHSIKEYQATDNPLFKLYETFEYQSRTWQIIGCICYEGTVKEWDSEDDVWEFNPWRYNSWWVINEAREMAWIIHDSTGYKWSTKTTMLGRIPEHNRSYEEGSWNIVSAVGEFSYFPTIGGASTTYERDANSIEILLDSKGKKKEVEAFINSPIKPLHLFTAFNKTDLVDALQRSRLALKLIGASVFCLLLGFFFLNLSSSTVLKTPAETIQHPFGSELITLGEMSLDKKSLLKFHFSGPIPRGNGNFEADLVIHDDRERVVSILPISIWRESGRDSDGAWTETNKSSSPLLNLPANKKYTLSLKPTSLYKWKKFSVSGHIQKNIASTAPIYLGIALFVLLLIFQFAARKNFIRKHTGLKV